MGIRGLIIVLIWLDMREWPSILKSPFWKRICVSCAAKCCFLGGAIAQGSHACLQGQCMRVGGWGLVHDGRKPDTECGSKVQLTGLIPKTPASRVVRKIGITGQRLFFFHGCSFFIYMGVCDARAVLGKGRVWFEYGGAHPALCFAGGFGPVFPFHLAHPPAKFSMGGFSVIESAHDDPFKH